MPPRNINGGPLLVDFALQGGGAHGAFTWGVLDCLLGKLWAEMRIHRVASPAMADLGYSSKPNAEWGFLLALREEGRRSADVFLETYGAALG